MTCMTGSTFAYASAQAVCAVSVCSEASSHSNIAMILDASLLLASIIICGLIISLRAIAMIAIIIAILVLVVGLVIQKANVPWCCELAI